MEKIHNFKSFSQLQNQLREEEAQKEMATKREASVAEYNELLAKYNVSKISELSEEDQAKFLKELNAENEALSDHEKDDADYDKLYKKYKYKDKKDKKDESTEVEEVSEAVAVTGKRDAKKVMNRYVKFFEAHPALGKNATGVPAIHHIGAIKKLYSLAMEDANFSREVPATAGKMKGRLFPVEVKVAELNNAIIKVSVGKLTEMIQNSISEITQAANYNGIAIVEGTAMYLDSIGQTKAAEQLMNAFNTAFNESVEIETVINEGTRGQFGKIYKSGDIASVYTHYDSYPEHMLSLIKRGYKKGDNVDTVISKGDNSGLELNVDKMNFYGGPNDLKPLKGKVKNIRKYIKDADANGAEYVYLFDERDGKWYMVDVYNNSQLVPAFESVNLNENYEVVYSDGVSHLNKFRSEAQALDFMKKEIDSNKKLKDIAVYKPGMHSTTQTELVVKFWGDGSYLDNVAKRDKDLASKKLK